MAFLFGGSEINLGSISAALSCLVCVPPRVVGSLRNYDGDGNGNVTEGKN